MRYRSAAILVLSFLLLGPVADAATMDFEAASVDNSPDFPLTTPYVENGIRMTANRDATWLRDSILDPDDGHMVMHFDGGTVTFDMFGSLFDLSAIDFDFVGFPETALEVTASNGFKVTLPSTDGLLGTVSFAGYTQFSSITFFDVYDPIGGACFEFDAITMSLSQDPGGGPTHPAIPEPCTMLLAGGGLLTVARLRKRIGL